GGDEHRPDDPQEHRAGQGGNGHVAQPLAVVVDLRRAQVGLQVPDHVDEHEPEQDDAAPGHGPLLAYRRLVQVERPGPLPPGRLDPAERRAALILLHQIQVPSRNAEQARWPASMVAVGLRQPRNGKFGGGVRSRSVTLDVMSFWPVQPFDPVTASAADVAGLHALDTALEREALPGEPVAPLAHTAARLRHALPFEVHRGWVVRQGGASGEIVARAAATYADVPENRHHADVWVGVHPAVRGLGIGSALLGRAVGEARRWGCTVLDFEARVGGPAEPFLRSVGAERRIIERRSRCRTAEIDRDRLEGWVRRAGERAAGYSLVAWDGRCPDEMVDAFVTLKGVMNTAPLEAFEWDEERLTVTRWREVEATLAARGCEMWQVAARHDDSGELAGYTELALLAHWPEMAWQEDTGV